jgi:hypothetical protein
MLRHHLDELFDPDMSKSLQFINWTPGLRYCQISSQRRYVSFTKNQMKPRTFCLLLDIHTCQPCPMFFATSSTHCFMSRSITCSIAEGFPPRWREHVKYYTKNQESIYIKKLSSQKFSSMVMWFIMVCLLRLGGHLMVSARHPGKPLMSHATQKP